MQLQDPLGLKGSAMIIVTGVRSIDCCDSNVVGAMTWKVKMTSNRLIAFMFGVPTVLQ